MGNFMIKNWAPPRRKSGPRLDSQLNLDPGFRRDGNFWNILTICFICLTLISFHPAYAATTSDTTVKNTWIAGLKSMSAQMTATQIQNAGIMGGIMDGVTNNNAILSMQTLQAGAYRDYTPGENLCRFGTLSRSLASADMAATAQTLAINTLLLNRETHNGPHGSPYADHDKLGKLDNLSNLYCNPGDNNGAPVACSCDTTKGTCTGPMAARSNRDLDFARLLGGRLTVDLNLTDGILTPDEQDIVGFLTTISAFPTLPSLSRGSSDASISPRSLLSFHDARQITAQRGLTRTTLSHFVGNRAQGGGDGTSAYMVALLQELGMSNEDAAQYLKFDGVSLTADGSDAARTHTPSYNAQMEILAKKIYQNPNYYTGLMDKPTNVTRAQAAQMAIRLMQRRDLYNVVTRREMLLSQLLESRLKTEENRMRTRLAQAKSMRD